MKNATAVLALVFLVVGLGDGNRKVTAGHLLPKNAGVQLSVASKALGGYQPVSDVSQHARMSVDVCEINTLLDARPIDFAAIGVIYRLGRHSTEANGMMRTFRQFASGDRSSEDLLSRYQRHLGSGWLHSFASAAIEGTGPFDGEPDLVRRQGVQKALRDQVLVAWTFHELDAAVDKATRDNFARDTGAPHNWDEARAYYHGEKPECAPYATAEERGLQFGTGSAINQGILAAMLRGLNALQASNAAGAVRARDELVRYVTITYIQSSIKYASDMDAALAQGKPDDARIWQAEGWAYFRVIEPLVFEVSPDAAQAVTSVFELGTKPTPGAGARVARALAEAYNPLKIHASEIGRYTPR
jgi:hypothetical protein